MGKVAGGLIGITRNDPARDIWGLTFNERASLAKDTHAMFDKQSDSDEDDFTHKDCGYTRIKRDYEDRIKIKIQFQRFRRDGNELVTLTTGDIAPDDIKDDL